MCQASRSMNTCASRPASRFSGFSMPAASPAANASNSGMPGVDGGIIVGSEAESLSPPPSAPFEQGVTGQRWRIAEGEAWPAIDTLAPRG